MTKMDVLVIAGIVALVAFVCFTMGMLVRRASDQDLIAELETELDARQLVRPAEIASEPVIFTRTEAAPLFARFDTVTDTTWDLPVITAPAGFLALPDWHAPVEDLDEHIAAMGAELQEYVAMLIAASQDA